MDFPLNVGDILAVTVGCYCDGQAGLNTVYHRVTAKTGLPTASLAADVMDTNLAALYKPLLTNTASYYGLKMVRIAPLPRSMFYIASGNTGVGTAGDAPLPTQVAGIITMETELSGPGFRGRIYVPFPDYVHADPIPVVPTDAYVTLLSALGEYWEDDHDITAGGLSVSLEPVIWHRDIETYTPIEEAVGRQKWGTQRRRGNYGQKNAYPPF